MKGSSIKLPVSVCEEEKILAVDKSSPLVVRILRE